MGERRDAEGFDLHVKVLGWLVLLSGLFGVMAACCLLFGMLGVATTADERVPRVILPIIGLAMSGFVGSLSAISVAAGYGLLRRRPWGRALALVDAFLGLLWFPIGTVFGLYAFWVLAPTRAADYFARPADDLDCM